MPKIFRQAFSTRLMNAGRLTMRRLERRLRALEQRMAPLVLPPFIVGLRRDHWPQPQQPGERLVFDYRDGGLIIWSCRITSDPEDNGVHHGCPGGYITECLRRRAAGLPSWPLPWEEDADENASVGTSHVARQKPEKRASTQRILWRPC